MYYVIGVSVPSLHRESTDSLIIIVVFINYVCICMCIGQRLHICSAIPDSSLTEPIFGKYSLCTCNIIILYLSRLRS